MLCFLCNIALDDGTNFNLEKSVSSKGSLLLNILEKIVNVKISFHTESVCNLCKNLLEEFEIADETCKQIRTKVTLMGVPERIQSPTKANCAKSSGNKNICSSKDLQTHNVNLSSILDVPSLELSCIICNETFIDAAQMENHTLYHNKKNSLKCDICNKSFRTKTGLLTHKGKQHSEIFVKEETVYCDNLTTLKKAKLLNLKPDMLDIKEENIVVEEKSDQDINETVNADVETKRRRGRRKRDSDAIVFYECSECPKKWKTAGELKSHMSKHSKIRPYICDKCGQAYKQKSALDIHIGMHNGINPFSCSYCNKVFTQKGALQRHIPIHTGEAPYQCDLCGKRFVHHTSFNMHKLTHSGQKDYKCELCGLGLLSGSHLKRHMRVHTGERPYMCSQCGKRFAERYNLVAHQKLHEAGSTAREIKRNHRCQICGKSFDRRIKLEEHLSNEHNKFRDNEDNKGVMDNFMSGNETLWHQKQSAPKHEPVFSAVFVTEYHS